MSLNLNTETFSSSEEKIIAQDSVQMNSIEKKNKRESVEKWIQFVAGLFTFHYSYGLMLPISTNIGSGEHGRKYVVTLLKAVVFSIRVRFHILFTNFICLRSSKRIIKSAFATFCLS